MYACMCVCVYVCMYACTYVCMYVRMRVCTCVCMYVCVHVCTYVCMYVVPYLTSMMCRDGDTFLACSRRLQVESQQWYIDHANTPHECSFGTGARGRSLMRPPSVHAASVRIRATLIAEGAEPRSACCLRLCQKCNLNQKTENWYCCQLKYCRSTTSLR